MTFVNFKNRPLDKNFNNAMENLFTSFPSIIKEELATPGYRQFVPVNIKETESGYALEVVAPGFKKEDFTINIEKNLLTVAADFKSEGEAKTEKLLKKEYRFQSFKRSFTIDENIDADNIQAQYINGVLVLNLPKKAEVKAAVKQINIQ